MKHSQCLFTGFLRTVSPLVLLWLSQGAPEKVKDKEQLRVCEQWSLF